MKDLAYTFIVLISVVVILIYGKGLLIPFVFALLLWFAVRELKAQLDRIRFLRERVASWIKYIITSAIMITILVVVSKLLSSNINELAQAYPAYEHNIDEIIHQVEDQFSVDLKSLLAGQSQEIDFGQLFSSVISGITDIMGNAFMILIYALFVFSEQANFQSKLKYLFKTPEQSKQYTDIINSIEVSISKYLGLKTLVSLITGFASYIVLFFIGIDSPVFWAFLIFLLNYIPTIGSLIATVFPAIFCLLQFGSLGPGLLVLGLVGSVQLLAGNVLEPKLLGNNMNLSPLVTILALSFWGAIWGITGMILSVPITVIMVIIFSQFEHTKPIAILLSERGNVS